MTYRSFAPSTRTARQFSCGHVHESDPWNAGSEGRMAPCVITVNGTGNFGIGSGFIRRSSSWSMGFLLGIRTPSAFSRLPRYRTPLLGRQGSSTGYSALTRSELPQGDGGRVLLARLLGLTSGYPRHADGIRIHVGGRLPWARRHTAMYHLVTAHQDIHPFVIGSN